MTTPFTDFSVDTGLLSFGVTRTYTSNDWSYAGGPAGVFGRGWHHNWEGWLSCSSGICTVTRGTAPGLKFQQTGTALSLSGTETWQIYSPSSQYGLTGDHHDILVRRPSGEWIVFLTDGSELHFASVCDTCGSGTGDPYCTDAASGGKARLMSVVDAKGHSVQLRYQRASGLLLGLSDDLGHTLELRSSSACTTGFVNELHYDGMLVATYSYTGQDLASAVDADGNVLRRYAYDTVATGRLQAVLNQAGDSIAEFRYDSSARAIGIIDRSSSVAVDYGASDGVHVTEYFGTSSSTSVRRLDRDGHATSISDNCACGPARLLQWTNRRLSCVADATNHVTWQSFDDLGRLTYRAEYASSSGCPSTAPTSLDPAQSREEWRDYGITRTIAQGVTLPLERVVQISRRSTVNSSAKYVAESDSYDPAPQSIDPTGYSCQQAPLPAGSVLCRRIESGYTYSSSGAVVLERHATFWSYDARGRLIKATGPINLDSPSASDVTPIEVRTYWPDSDTLPRRGRLQQVMRYPAPSANPLTTSYDYDAFGPFSITFPDGGSQTAVKDGRGRPIAVVAPDGAQVQTRYHDGLDPRIQVLPSGAAVRSSYDSIGRLISVEHLSSDPDAPGATPILGWAEYHRYDPAGNRTRTERRDGTGTVTWQQDRTFDVQHRLVTDTNPEAPTTARTNTFDSAGFLTSVTDEQGRATTYTPDGLNRVQKVTRSGLDSTGANVSLDVAQYAYQPSADSLAQVSDGRALNTAYQHDDFGRLTQLSSPNHGPLHFSYDARGNLLQKWDDHITVSFTYDGLDRLLTTSAANSTDGSAVAYSYQYDQAPYPGRLTTAIEPDRTVHYGYDSAGRLTGETIDENGVPAPLETQYSYAADGALTGIVYPSGLRLQLVRDPATRDVVQVIDLASSKAYASQVTHLPGGPVKSLVFGNGLTLAQSFNRRHEPLSIQSGPLSLSYTPTPAGDLGAQSDHSLDPSGCTQDASRSMGYDFLDRLTSFSDVVQGGTGTCAADSLAGPSSGLTFVGGTDLVASQRTPDSSGRPVFAFGYDGEANISAIGQYDVSGASIATALCLRHDALGRLVLVGNTSTPLTPGGAACVRDSEVSTALERFKYDARNRRVARQQGSQWTYVVPDGSGNPLSELVLVGGAWSNLRDYVWLDGRLLAQIEYAGLASTYFAHLDHLGTPRALTNANGQPVWSSFQLPYGEAHEKTATDPLSGRTVVTNVRLPGQYDERLFQQAGINLPGPYYNWNRWYLPNLGRYMELDPVASRGGFNGAYGSDWYAYGSGNSFSNTDPDGMKDVPFEGGGGGGSGGSSMPFPWPGSPSRPLPFIPPPPCFGPKPSPPPKPKPAPDPTPRPGKSDCVLIGSGGKGPRPGATRRCTYLCTPANGGSQFQIDLQYEECPDSISL